MFLSFHKGMLKEDNATTFRMLYYPPLGEAPLPYATRCGEHTDYGTFTLLSQDTEGGLEVLVRTELYCANDLTIKESYWLEYNWVGFINSIIIFYFWKMILFHQIDQIKICWMSWVHPLLYSLEWNSLSPELFFCNIYKKAYPISSILPVQCPALESSRLYLFS